ncbi:MAG: hypothetical protein GY953_42535, partial [bacterium]|nr:hypothetical protein [bacterium]
MSDPVLLTALFFAAIMAAVVTTGYYYLRRREAAARPSQVEPDPEIQFSDSPLPSTQAALAKALHFMGESVPAARKDDEPIRQKLLKAGYRWPTAATIFHGVRIASALGLAGLVGWCLLLFIQDPGSTLLPAFCGAGLGYLLPEMVLRRMIGLRGRRIRSGVPAAVDLLVLALEAGQSLDQSLHDVARALGRTYPELSEEFMFCRLEMRAGKSRYEALRHLSDRSPDNELKKLTAVLLDGDRYGTSLGPALRTHSRLLRVRLRHGVQ